MAGDWIKLHRKMLDSPIFQHDGLFRLWSYCLLRAAWKDGRCLVRGTLREAPVPRGSFVTGRHSLFAALYPRCDEDGRPILREWTPHPQTVWRWLEALETMGCVTMNVMHHRCTIVTVCNYSLYQDNDDASCTSDAQVMHKSCTSDAQVMHTVEEGKKGKKVRSNPPFIPPSVEQVAEYCRERGNRVDAQTFVDFYTGKGWMVGKNRMADWRAAVRTWEKRALGNGRPADLFAGQRAFLEKHSNGEHEGRGGRDCLPLGGGGQDDGP